MLKAKDDVASDYGTIYIGTNCDGEYIRFNRIVNYTGRGANRGIYGDDGAHDIYIIGNIIENVPNSYSIDAR